MITKVIDWISLVIGFIGMVASLLLLLFIVGGKPELVGMMGRGLVISLGMAVVGVLGMQRDKVVRLFLDSGVIWVICFVGVLLSVWCVVGCSVGGDLKVKEHMEFLRWSWFSFQVCMLGVYIQVINMDNTGDSNWKGFWTTFKSWIKGDSVWMVHAFGLITLGCLFIGLGAWSGIWKVLIMQGVMWWVFGVGMKLWGWKSIISSEIVGFVKKCKGEDEEGVVHGAIKVNSDGEMVVWDDDMSMWIPAAIADQIGTSVHPFGSLPAPTNYNYASDDLTECDKLEEDKEGEGDDMKAIWKTLKGKEGGLLWLKVGEEEKVPAKYVLDPLLKECKKKGMMVLVTKGTEIKVVPDLSGVSDEVLKGMGLIRYNFGLEAAVVAEVWKDDEDNV